MATKNAIDSGNPIEVAKGGIGVASTTAYGVITGGTTATGAFQNAGTGTAGQLLQSNGSSSLPTWATVGVAGSLVLIDTKIASASASITFTSGISSTYKNYLILIGDVLPATNTQNLLLQYSTDGGSNYIATGYLSGINYNQYNSTTYTNANTTTGILVAPSIENVDGPCFSAIWLTNATSGSGMVRCHGQTGFYQTSAVRFNGVFSSSVGSSKTINALKFIFASGNITSGYFSLYGVLP